MSKRFSELTDAEVLALDNQQLNDAIRIEAIERGHKPPVPLSEAIRSSEWRGYQKPADAVEVWEIIGVSQYGSPNHTGFGYLTKERADAAIEGMVALPSTGYGSDSRIKIQAGNFSVNRILIGAEPAQSKASKFSEYSQDDTEFDKIVDECMARHSEVRQAAYNKRVRAERKVEYLRLAQGNEEVAKAFWAKAEGTEWPAETI